jgi:hypothetical protein
MKNTPIHVCAKTAFVAWPSTESRELDLSVTSRSLIIYLQNTLNYCIEKNVVMVTLSTDIYISRNHLHALLGVGNFMKVVRVCADHLCEWSAIARSLRNTDVDEYTSLLGIFFM